MSQTSSRRTQADRPVDEPESNPQPVAADQDPRLLRWHAWLWAVFIVAATFTAYWPAWHGEFVWDDAAWTTTVERHLDDLSGLLRAERDGDGGCRQQHAGQREDECGCSLRHGA